ncbi:C45 family autoproteolytic acyltransferase/hydolase [Phytohabitans rumicis]|uniref:Peptidase C45 hydrolase domain-containing protein n=1 Tax=Phytohabitans rumicis TaxID=1076125 RepID=A0A6V8LB23_9ACTN|nr:C45 family peptidase [Phytohabitans rumicis]GFJ91981.1 hypothetical protein Prum_056230 [Phytohabitans rumicis]
MTFPGFASSSVLPFSRGREFGTVWRDEVRATASAYEALFAAHGGCPARTRAWAEEAFARTADWAPQLADEMAGIASGSGLETWRIAALNARTEILAALRVTGEGECSTVVCLPVDGQAPRTMQTWDWHDRFGGAPILWSYDVRPGHTVRTFTEFGVLGKIGVNSAGLGAHFNILRHASDSDRIGVPVHLVARRILDDARTVAEAADIARSARLSASTVITVVTEGAAASLELCPAGVAVVPVAGLLLHTNHFLDPSLATGERLGTERPGTYARLEHLRDQADGLVAADLTARARAMLSHEVGGPVCAHANPAEPFHQRWETLATIALDVRSARVYAHRGGPCTATPSTWQLF